MTLTTPVFRRPRRGSRAGYLYVAVLFTSLIVAGAIATAISLDTTRLKTTNAATDRESAIRLAETELHRVSVQLIANPGWRDELIDGVASDWIAYGAVVGASNADARFRLSDEDGDLADDEFDDVDVVAHARFGSAQAAVAVQMESGFAPLDLLQYGVTTFDDLHCEDGSTLVSEKNVQVFDDCKTNSVGFITTSKLECSGSLALTVRGDIGTDSFQPIDFDVVDRYRNVGTEIQLGSLPIHNGVRTIRLAVVSPNSNPYGLANENGYYWVDAMGQQVNVVDSRIVATIAIRNASRVVVSGAVSWEAARSGEAILVTDSHVVVESLQSTLDENTLAVNFNPPATPYRNFDSNLTTTDRFPTEFRGIVYTEGELSVLPTTAGDPVAITGAVICQDLVLYHDLFVSSLDEMLTNVPIGFADPSKLRFKIGTFRRVPTF
ncbi:MAG: hypothetical protein KDB00_13795 [Planctomycetales bacterium]|nr:hypothetical protein [Planctomycetales bacterium]